MKKTKSFYTRRWFVPVVIGALILLHGVGVLQPFERLLIELIQPVQGFLYARMPEQNQSERGFDEVLRSEQELKSQVENLIVENIHLKNLVEQSSLLQEQLAFLEQSSYKTVQAKVVSKTVENLTQTIVINKGSSDGVNRGYPVVIDNGVLIGIVQKVEAAYAQVELVTNPDILVSATVQNEVQSPGVVNGEHSLTLRMRYIPQFDSVLVDQAVLTSGDDAFIPKGLIIGTVSEVLNNQNELFQEVALEPLFSVSSLSIVSILVE